MRTGMATIFQNLGHARPDGEVYRDELALADAAESMGFDSLWAVEHHFTDYTMCPDPVQFLTYMAGRTTTAQLGTMVVVLPWHDPIRVAESIAVLDAVSGGRVVLGIGRGLGRIEFEGFGVPMEESRDRFVDAARIVLAALEDGVVEHEGTHLVQAKRAIRPAPERSFRGRTYAAAVSPESIDIMAELGVGILVIPQKPWQTVETELATYRSRYRERNGADAPATVLAGWVYCHEDEEVSRSRAERYIGAYYHSVLEHYELASSHFAETDGYSYYSRMAQILEEDGADEATRFFVDLQVWGTPEQCIDRIRSHTERVGAETFIGVFSYGGMPMDEATASYELFARDVLPAVKDL